MVLNHTRKKRAKGGTLSTVCHPRVKVNDCLPPTMLEELGSALGAPSSLKGAGLRQWMTQRTRCRTERCWLEKSTMDANKKKELQAIVQVRGVHEMDQGFGTDLAGQKPEYYSAPMFGSLNYEDLRKAHTESVVPVTHDDYLKRPQYKNTDELLKDPDYLDVKPLSLQQSQTYLRDKEMLQSKTDVGRAYNLARQDEVSRKGNQGFMAGFKQLL